MFPWCQLLICRKENFSGENLERRDPTDPEILGLTARKVPGQLTMPSTRALRGGRLLYMSGQTDLTSPDPSKQPAASLWQYLFFLLGSLLELLESQMVFSPSKDSDPKSMELVTCSFRGIFIRGHNPFQPGTLHCRSKEGVESTLLMLTLLRGTRYPRFLMH